MRYILKSISCFALASFCAFQTASAITIDTVPIGNAANPSDPNSVGGYGSVSYNYRIGTTEVTNAQYAAFLNAKAATDLFELYSTNMGSDARGGISRSGSDGNYTYSVRTNMGNKPVNFVGWFDAVRFANWLSNGQGNGSTETGAYTLLGGTTVPSNWDTIARNDGSSWYLPSENEWYKAAYYDTRSEAQGGPPGNDNYWRIATKSDGPIHDAVANSNGDISNPGANVINFDSHAIWNGVTNVTTVGSAGLLSASFYGTFDQAGNLDEWTDTPNIDSSSRIVRGGSFLGGTGNIWSSTGRFTNLVLDQAAPVMGFRVATIPEPSSFLLAGIAGIGLFMVARRRRVA